jgi:hypothetical protein
MGSIAETPHMNHRNYKEESKRGEAPLQKNLPLPLFKGKGIQGIGLLYNLIYNPNWGRTYA